jgi:hypothetical protein
MARGSECARSGKRLATPLAIKEEHFMRIPVAVILASIALAGCGSSPTAPSNPTPTKAIRLEGNMAFGEIAVGATFDATLRVFSTGTQPLTVTGLSGPSAYTASWTSGTIPAGASQTITIRFSPTAATTYNGTLSVQSDSLSGTNSIAISGTGVRDLFRRSGSGDTVFDMPLDVARVRVVGTYTSNSSNFIVRIGGRLIVNELLGTFWNQTRYDGTLLTGGGGVVAIANSSGVAWSIDEVR